MATRPKARSVIKRRRDRTSNARDDRVSKGYDNVFQAFGPSDPEERLAKALLARVIRERIEAEGWTGVRAAKALGVAPSDVSDLLRGKLTRFSFERLERFLTALDMNVRIVISPKRPSQKHANISVELASVTRG
jgi:predicted XRE-type DNA-binding protein